MSDARNAFRDLVLDVSFEKRKVTLASGRESDFYLDMRQTMMRPQGVKLAGELLLEKLGEGDAVDAVGGMAVGAVPLVSAVLAAAGRDAAHEHLLGFFVRKEAKGHGLGRQVEGAFKEGQKIALLEDTTTTGGSTLKALDLVKEAGGDVRRVICLVDRGEGATEAFAERGIQLESILGRADLPV